MSIQEQRLKAHHYWKTYADIHKKVENTCKELSRINDLENMVRSFDSKFPKEVKEKFIKQCGEKYVKVYNNLCIILQKGEIS